MIPLLLLQNTCATTYTLKYSFYVILYYPHYLTNVSKFQIDIYNDFGTYNVLCVYIANCRFNIRNLHFVT